MGLILSSPALKEAFEQQDSAHLCNLMEVFPYSFRSKQFSSVPALKKCLVMKTTDYFCQRYVLVAVIALQINWDML